ncbi:hypothetical protein CF319_g9478 [Tilletia indica]|nr:hypothetical protein CF319_g9478 [Tilletia indica]
MTPAAALAASVATGAGTTQQSKPQFHYLVQRCNDEVFEGKLSGTYLMEALTASSALYSFNYQRLEFIGDSFLQLMATAYVVADGIKEEVESLNAARVDIVCNQTLAQHGGRHRLDDFLLKGRAHSVGQKTLADLAESVMGAGLMTAGMDGALHVARCLGITPRPVQSLRDLGERYYQNATKCIKAAQVDFKMPPEELSKLERFLQYKFYGSLASQQWGDSKSNGVSSTDFSALTFDLHESQRKVRTQAPEKRQ